MVHGKPKSNIWDHAASGHVDTSSCLWVSCYVLGSFSSAGPVGKPTRPKLVPRSPLPKNHRSQESQQFRMENYSSSSILTARAAQRVLDKTQAPNDRSVLERLKCDPRRYPGPGRQWLMLWFWSWSKQVQMIHGSYYTSGFCSFI